MTHATPRPWKADTNGNVWYGISAVNVRDPEYGAASHEIGIERHAIATFHGTKAQANRDYVMTAMNTLPLLDEAKAALELARVCFNRVLGTGADASTDIRFHALMVQADLQAKAVLATLEGGAA